MSGVPLRSGILTGSANVPATWSAKGSCFVSGSLLATTERTKRLFARNCQEETRVISDCDVWTATKTHRCHLNKAASKTHPSHLNNSQQSEITNLVGIIPLTQAAHNPDQGQCAPAALSSKSIERALLRPPNAHPSRQVCKQVNSSAFTPFDTVLTGK